MCRTECNIRASMMRICFGCVKKVRTVVLMRVFASSIVTNLNAIAEEAEKLLIGTLENQLKAWSCGRKPYQPSTSGEAVEGS